MRSYLVITIITIMINSSGGPDFSEKIIIDSNEICYFDIVGKNCAYIYPDGTVCVLDTNTGKIKSSFIVERFKYDEDSNTVDRLQYYDEHSQFFQISNASMPVLAVNGGELDKEGYFYGLIDFYDLYLGKKLRTVRMKNDFGLTGLGFSGDGKYFYSCGLESWSISCIDVKSGDIIWRSSLDFSVSDAYMRADGKSYVIFSFSNQIAAYNKDGDVLWRIKTKDFWVRPTLQPLEPSDVVLVFPEGGDERYEIAAMSLQDGSIMWRKPEIEDQSIRSTTKDRKKQAIYMNGNMCISHYPEDKIIKIPGIKERCDAVFSQDGKTLFCLPELKRVHVNKEKLIVNRERSSHLLKIVDCNTGKIVKEIELTKPAVR